MNWKACIPIAAADPAENANASRVLAAQAWAVRQNLRLMGTIVAEYNRDDIICIIGQQALEGSIHRLWPAVLNLFDVLSSASLEERAQLDRLLYEDAARVDIHQ
jgi:hypothetical protein